MLANYLSKSCFHTSSAVKAAHPHYYKVRLTRKLTLQHLRKLKEQQEALGDKFRFLSKHRRHEGLPGFIPDEPKTPKFIPFMLTKDNLKPAPIVPGSIPKTMNNLSLKTNEELVDGSYMQNKADGKSSENAKIPTTIAELTRENVVVRELKNRPENIPPVVPTEAFINPDLVLDFPIPENAAAAGPYYAFGLTPSEIKFVLEDTPVAMDLIKNKLKTGLTDYRTELSDGKMPTLDEQAEIIRRVLSVDNASAKDLRSVNKQRIMSVLQENPIDVGSYGVQGNLYTFLPCLISLMGALCAKFQP